MSLERWSSNRWIAPHDISAEELQDLLSVVDRDLRDAAVKGLSDDARIAFAYNAGLQLATIALHAAGYRVGRERHHERAIESLQYTVNAPGEIIDALDIARRRRNVANYERAGAASPRDSAEMLRVAKELRALVVAWLERVRPELLAP